MVPSINFFILFQPQWKVNFLADPVLLGEVQGEYFKIAEWGGDVDILSEFILEKL